MSLYDEIEAAVERYMEGDQVLDGMIKQIIHEIVEPREAYAHKQGYSMGEMERVALATANSDLRSEILLLQAELAEARSDLAQYKWEHGYPAAG